MSYLGIYLTGVLLAFVYGAVIVIFTLLTTKDNDATWKHYAVILGVFPIFSWLAVLVMLFV